MIKEIFIKGRSYLYEETDGKTIIYSPYPTIKKKKKYKWFGKNIIVKTFDELFTLGTITDESSLKLIIKRRM